MKALFVLNDPPYGTYNGLRLAHALLKNNPAAATVSANKVLAF